MRKSIPHASERRNEEGVPRTSRIAYKQSRQQNEAISAFRHFLIPLLSNPYLLFERYAHNGLFIHCEKAIQTLDRFGTVLLDCGHSDRSYRRSRSGQVRVQSFPLCNLLIWVSVDLLAISGKLKVAHLVSTSHLMMLPQPLIPL